MNVKYMCLVYFDFENETLFQMFPVSEYIANSVPIVHVFLMDDILLIF